MSEEVINESAEQMRALGENLRLAARPRTLPPLVLSPPDFTQTEGIYGRLVAAIKKFEAALKPDEVIGIRLATGMYELTHSTYMKPGLIVLMALDDDMQEVQIIQHVSQINVTLTKLAKRSLTPEAPRKPVGFTTERE